MIFNNFKVWIYGSVIFFVVINLIRLANQDSFGKVYANAKCRWSLNMQHQEFQGFVDSKNLDSKNHNKPTIFLSGKIGIKKVHFANERKGFYDFVEVSDSLSKKSGELEVTVVRNGQQIIKELDFGCRK